MGKLPSFSIAGFSIAGLSAQYRAFFKTRDLILHDGRDLRRFSVGGRSQALFAGVIAIALCFSAYGVANAALIAARMSGAFAAPQTAEARVVQLQGKLAAMRANVVAIKRAAEVRAARLEQRQALITAVLTGKKPSELALKPVALDAATASTAAEILAPFARVEHRQSALAGKVLAIAEHRYAAAIGNLEKLGINTSRFSAQGGTGGPYEPLPAAQSVAEAQSDAQFRSLFVTWKKLDSVEQAAIAIPAAQPVRAMSYSSNFGVRTDPFRGTAAMHAGVDIPGAIGTPIYATADGIVSRSERSGGYGNLVEINHGRGISTRYGHLSKLLVAVNARVTRGQLIGLMGSTGRSTGSHLHYEVRIDGQAVNPVPFLQSADYLTTAATTPKDKRVAVGGDESGD